MTLIAQLGGPAGENAWLVLFIIGAVAAAFMGGEYFETKAKRLDRKQARLDETTASLDRTMRDGKCPSCMKRHRDLLTDINSFYDQEAAAS